LFLERSMGNQSGQHTWPVISTKQTPHLPFAVTTLGDYTCDNHYYTRRQGMEQGLLIYTLHGSGVVEHCGNQFVVEPGQFVAIDCRKYHYYATLGEEWHFLWIHFTGKCAFDYLDLLNSDGGTPVFLGSRFSFEAVYEKMRSVVQTFDLQNELALSGLMMSLLTDLIRLKRGTEFSRKYGHYQSALEESIQYLHTHYGSPITVEHLAGICHLSKFYYIKVFKSYTGLPPYDYLLRYRLQQAQKMLLESDASIEEIALAAGFSDSKNFITCFKNRLCTTPLQFRKQEHK